MYENFSRMGFSEYEKYELLNTLRKNHKIEEIIETEYPDDVITFIKNEGLLRQLRDYCIMPKLTKLNRPENITITYLLDSQNSIYRILQLWQEFMTPPVRFLNL